MRDLVGANLAASRALKSDACDHRQDSARNLNVTGAAASPAAQECANRGILACEATACKAVAREDAHRAIFACAPAACETDARDEPEHYVRSHGRKDSVWDFLTPT